MPSHQFTSILKFCQQFKLRQDTTQNLLENIQLPIFSVSQKLVEDIEEAQQLPLYTEKAKSELLITPILKELKRKNPQITFFSGYALKVEKEPQLNGNPDYVLSAKPNLVEIEAPIFCIMESKNKAPDEGFAQCAAEMYASRLFNEEMNEPYHTIYGAVTNGFDWVFMKLEDDLVSIDSKRYYIDDLPRLLSIFQFIINQVMNKRK